jgi:predicted nucleic acid-binding protein
VTKRQIACNIVSEPSVISVQLLSEFANVARKKLGFELQTIRQFHEHLLAAHSVRPLDIRTILLAHAIAEDTGYSTHDCNIVAVALLAGCKILYTEDMDHGRVVFDSLTIINPFKMLPKDR